MSRDARKEIIKKIEEKRKSKLIAYVTSDRPNLSGGIAHDVVSVIHNHMLGLQEEKEQKFDLFIYSRGGQSDVPWTIVSMFREYAKKGSFSVLIPYRAHSAATVISLGADEIVMTKKAELGPIDITINNGPFNPKDDKTGERLPVSVEDVTGYFSLLGKVGCQRADEKMNGFNKLTDKVHPLVLGHVNRSLEETKLVGLRLLSTRAKPFAEEDNHEIIKRISSEVYSHSHAINRFEAKKYIGLKQIKNAEDIGIDNELWNLYEEYKKLFDFESPFMPEEHLVVNNLDEHKWENLPIASVESTTRFDIFRQDLRVRKLRTMPPQVNINLSNVNLPALNIPTLPPNITAQQLQALIQTIAQQVMQQALNQAAQAGAQQLLNSLPLAGFEKFNYNATWRKEA